MELWIRSQDKMNLACVYNLYVIERDFAKNDSIWWEILCNDEISLGLYQKERALEVLDEIQKRIIGKQGMITSVNYKKIEFVPFLNQVVIYEMPKE